MPTFNQLVRKGRQTSVKLSLIHISVPVTILEMGFMTSQNDDLKMNDAEFQKTMVQGIANGIDSYFAS